MSKLVESDVMQAGIEPDIGIEASSRKSVIRILSNLLADEYVLYTKTRNYHWNVYGPHFHDLHVFFEEQYKELEESIDEVAERITTLGGKAIATLKEFTQYARLEESPKDYPNAAKMIENLCKDHEETIKVLRKDADACEEKYEDMGTNDFLIGLMQKHEKMAWMLRQAIDERGVKAATGRGQAAAST
ncbi:MAG: Dps family protein [Nitrososphaera sp.]|uniref:Dps family protein n=1 Tax=Nitrososphaera sp. TaxID=1971748 RepID=UPI003D6EFE40